MEPRGVSRGMFTLVDAERRSRRPGYSLPASMLAHAIGVALVILPLLGSTERSAQAKVVRRFIVLAPPAAAAPPLPKGPAGGHPTKARHRAPRIDVNTPPVEIPTEVPLPAETAVADDAQPAGDPDGSEKGDPEGISGGAEGGVRGGVPWGTVGGCPGCDGEGPVGDWDQAPRILRQAPPVYPQEAFVKKIEGTVLLEILIGANGDVVATRILRSIPALDQAAVQAVRQWRFTPAFRRGRPVAMWAQAPVQFKIH
jgi:protein TonB